ncbi:MAG TPA: glycine betaine ABC transporter substrate-binding protein [Herpetosiphonaceae bacterium]
MQHKGSWSRILGLLLVLAFIMTACGQSGTTTDGSTSGTATSQTSATTDQSPAASASAAASPSGSAAASPAGGGATIKVGSKNFTEEFIRGEMYKQLLEANGFTVEENFGLASEAVAHEALKNGEIDLYPEYTSTGLQAILKLPAQKDRQEIFNTVKSEYEKQFQITWLDPSPFENNQALAMTKARADELGIKTYSDLSQKAGDLILGGPAEFFEREDGVKGLQTAYGGFQFKDNKQLDPSLRYGALTNGEIDVVVAFSTDGEIGGLDLTLLEDDKQFYPPYQVAPVIRQDTLNANPQIADILNALAPKLADAKTMANLNYAVDGPDKKEPADVAKQFLTEQGLIK